MKITPISGGVCAPAGFEAAGIHCGIAKKPDKKDLALIVSEVDAACAAVYTQNKVQGAPIWVTQEHIADGKARAILCNSGNANTCNADGPAKAKRMCQLAGDALDIPTEDVVVASTGVIGQSLPIEPIEGSMHTLVSRLSPQGSGDAVKAIMTTDLAEKEIAVSFELGGKTCTIGGIAKGSGMIHPNMATMLAFITTDVCISSGQLQAALDSVVKDTFNMVSVDGDTSTNDMCAVLANGLAGNTPILEDNEDFEQFVSALTHVCIYLARSMAADGEGATKLLECRVTGAPTEKAARILAKSVITSSLFKAAMFGEDANWGRILCALGYAPCDFDIDLVAVTLASAAGSVEVCRMGAGVSFSEEEAKKVLQEKEIEILVSLDQGDGVAVAWGCDLSYDYVKINGDYRS
ncbi:bifunctional glutamate N-acetyltransferase/amino-acid acetyltransferase ArgJ [Oscillospiraceae bacterium MB08-C2-2]|nr:bifunctional glutamate N-acetyltransferase/amino-acid acetyltransferase ArgJ [Oscillospiraceae bacterium MB08-C2-2]